MALPSRTTPPVLSCAALDATPHQIFREMRPHFPFIERDDGVILVLRARDVERLITDQRTRQIETELLRSKGVGPGPVMDLVSNSLLFSNGETHRRRRQPLSRAFAFRMMEGLRPTVRSLAEALVDEKRDSGLLHLRDDFASLVPAITLAAILGIPRTDVPVFTALSYRVSKILTSSWTRDDLPDIEQATQDLTLYIEALIEDRRRHPRPDFLSDYVETVDRAGAMTALEAIMQIVSVVLGGSDTTRAAIVVMAGLLLEHGLWQELRRQPALIGAVVSESLRCEPAVGSVPRLTIEEIELDGAVVPAGRPVLLSTMSALRDPEVFPNPDRFELTRPTLRWHPVFGGGEHRCLGEALAKIEMEEALSVLLAALPDPRIDGQGLTIHGHAGVRKVEELTLRWH
ncbi:cytochrome P450 [Rhizobium sp. YIM 134829]|uniref:cytochrome P450 n=1 Tax=Rhizobium sp. YIM 134829 TaxID=3390453 RepID=UPI00397CD389